MFVDAQPLGFTPDFGGWSSGMIIVRFRMPKPAKAAKRRYGKAAMSLQGR